MLNVEIQGGGMYNTTLGIALKKVKALKAAKRGRFTVSGMVGITSAAISVT